MWHHKGRQQSSPMGCAYPYSKFGTQWVHAKIQFFYPVIQRPQSHNNDTKGEHPYSNLMSQKSISSFTITPLYPPSHPHHGYMQPICPLSHALVLHQLRAKPSNFLCHRTISWLGSVVPPAGPPACKNSHIAPLGHWGRFRAYVLPN